MSALEPAKLVAALHDYASKAGLEERLEAAGRLQQLVLESSAAAVRAAITRCRGDPTELVQAALTGVRPDLTASPPSAQAASQLAAVRVAAYKAALALLGPQQQQGEEEDGEPPGVQLTERQATTLVSVLDTELASNTGAADLSEIAEAAMDAFEGDAPLGAAALELLPKALALLSAAGGEVGMPGEAGDTATCQVADVGRGIIRRVCQHAWPLGSIAKVLASLRSFPLTQEGLKEAVQRGTQRAKAADTQDLPAIVHQLLMLSGRGCREFILQEIMHLFEHKEAVAADSANQRRQLLEVQGMALLHIDMAAKHDAELGQAWLRALRGAAPPRLTAFALALSFTLAGIQRFEQPVTDALKALVMGAYKDAALLAASPWLPPPSSAAAAGGGAGQAAALAAALVACARNSGHGQGGIVQPMVGLATGLIEAGSSSGSGFAAGAGAKSSTAATAAAAAAAVDDATAGAGDAVSPGQRAAALGARLLLELYEAHTDFRRDIICLCHNRLIGAKEEVAAPYVRLLALLVRRNQATIGDHMSDMKLSLEHLAFLPPNAALALLLAVWPMCRARRDAQDYVVMLLRKAMFSRELHARLLAARGFLYMITQELQNGTADGTAYGDAPGPSQASMSQLGALTGGSGGGATLLHEVMSFLRRCLTQQPEVRRAIYDGMPALLAADPSVQDSVVEPLLPHFLQFYEQDEQLTPPLKLELCARVQGEGVRLIEPLQHLLAGVRRVLRAAGGGQPAGDTDAGDFCLLSSELLDGPRGDVDGSATAALRSRFAALRRRLAESTLEDFQLDASSDFSLATPSGQQGHATADVLLGCMEVALEDLVDALTEPRPDEVSGSAGEEAEEVASALHHLFSQHQRLMRMVEEGAKGYKKKVEGLTQAVGDTARRGPGRPPGASSLAPAGVVPLDKRVPAFSLGCLGKLLDAVADDGFKLPEGADTPATMAADVKLCRDPAFATFALTAALRQLQACEASELGAAIATGTAGSEADAAAACALFAVPDCQTLAAPVFRAAQTAVLSNCKSRAVVGGGAGGKKEKDPAEAMTQAAMRTLHQLLSMAAAGGVAGLAAVLQQWPAPSPAAVAAADLPTVAGLTELQAAIAAKLPLLHELFEALLKPSCARELEPLCASLALLAGALPPPLAGDIADWAVGACESLSGLGVPATARALLHLAVQGRAAAAGSPLGGRGGTGGGTAGDGDDLDLLQAVANDVRGMVNAEEAGEEGERFGAVNARTHVPMLGVLGAHLEGVLSNLEWALGRVRALSGAARDLEPGSARARLEAQRAAWERAAMLRLHKGARVLATLAETQLTGAPCEALVKSLIRFYKLLGAAAKAQLAPKGSERSPATAFVDLASWVNTSCTPVVYNFIQEVHGQHDEEHQENATAANDADAQKAAKKRARATTAAASRAKRESKQVPNLIFQVEEYERHLIRISKTSKVNLMGTARRATNRDFKIRLDKYNEGAQAGGGGKRRRQQAAEEEDGQAEEGEEEEAGAMEGEGEELVQEEEEEEEA